MNLTNQNIFYFFHINSWCYWSSLMLPKRILLDVTISNYHPKRQLLDYRLSVEFLEKETKMEINNELSEWQTGLQNNILDSGSNDGPIIL